MTLYAFETAAAATTTPTTTPGATTTGHAGRNGVEWDRAYGQPEWFVGRVP